MTRSTARELAVIRRAYAAHILAEAGVRSAPLERAFAAVPREAFLGRGPWQILRWGRVNVPLTVTIGTERCGVGRLWFDGADWHPRLAASPMPPPTPAAA